MQKIGDILKTFDPTSGKYISREFQAYGLYLAQKLGDDKHRSLYIKLAKTEPRYILEEVLSFVLNVNAKNKGAMFMWKLKEFKNQLKNAKKKRVKK